MPGASFLQTSFLGGEISQTAQGRADLPAYRTSMNVCLNAMPTEQGAWTRRPGTRFGAATRNGLPARVVPYAFQQNAPYTMEFTDGHIRFFSGTNLAITIDGTAVASISSASPAVVTLSSAVPWDSGDYGYFAELVGADQLLNRQFKITVTGTDTFTLYDAISGDPIDGSALNAFVSGGFVRIQDIVSPYVGGAWKTLQSIQADTNAILTNNSVQPHVISPTSLPSVGVDAQFSLTPANFADGPYLDPPTNGALMSPANITGLINLAVTFSPWVTTKVYDTGDYVTFGGISYISVADKNVGQQPGTHPSSWAAVNAATAVTPSGFFATDIGRHIRLFSEPPEWVVGTSYVNGNVVKYANAYYTCLSGSVATSLNAPGTSLTTWGINPIAARWTWGKITALLNILPSNPVGSVVFGDMTINGGNAAAFNGNTSQPNLACAAASTSVGPGTNFHWGTVGYAGQHFATAQAITSATVYPASDTGFISSSISPLVPGTMYVHDATATLYGSNSMPATSTDGTVLGTTTIPGGYGPYGVIDAGPNAIAIQSSLPNSTWSYVWVTISVIVDGVFGTDTTLTVTVYVAQIQFSLTPSSVIGSGTPNGVQVQLHGDDLLYTSPITTWRLGAYSASTGWPSCGTYHEGRLWLAGSIKNRFDGSKPNQEFAKEISFSPTEPDGTVTPASGIAYTLNAPDVNTILWMKPDQQGIVIGTEKGEWLVQATTLNAPLTATSIQAHRVTRIGAAAAVPVETEHTTVFIQRYAQKIMEYFADIYSGKFSAPNLAVSAAHLTGRGLVELAYQQSLAPVIWGRCVDGSLLGCSYKRESLMSSQGPTYAAWHHHQLGSGRTVDSVAVGPSPDGTTDTLAMVTSDGVTRYVEFLTENFTEADAGAAAWFLDCGIIPAATQNIVMGGVSGCELTGLWHLNGKTVAAFIGGLDCGDFVVSDGKINVRYGSAGGLFTAEFAAAATDFVVGFTYTSDGQVVRPIAPQESGARNGPALGKTRRVHQYAALFNKTQGISFGTSFANGKLNAAQFKTKRGIPYAQNELYSGVHWQTLTDENSFDGMICWRVTRPYPATIAMLEGFLATQDT